jgi:hypothetical protein
MPSAERSSMMAESLYEVIDFIAAMASKEGASLSSISVLS